MTRHACRLSFNLWISFQSSNHKNVKDSLFPAPMLADDMQCNATPDQTPVQNEFVVTVFFSLQIDCYSYKDNITKNCSLGSSFQRNLDLELL